MKVQFSASRHHTQMNKQDREDNFQPEKLKRLPRGSFLAKPGDTTDPKKTKVRVTLYLDSDVLAFFKQRAAEPFAAPYQTQINNELRGVMERQAEPVLGLDYSKLLQNRGFIAALAEKVEEYRVSTQSLD